MNDQQAAVTLEAVLELAVAVRDDGPEQVKIATRRVLDAAGGDPAAALTVAAALVRVDLPVDAWWQRGLAGVGAGLVPCGTHAAFNRHKARGEDPCGDCETAEREYQRARGPRLSTAARRGLAIAS